MTILVTGGAGYIGSHFLKTLKMSKSEDEVVVIDDLSTGFKEAVTYGEFIEGDFGDEKILEKVFSQYNIQSIIHFAGSIVVPESVENPIKYYENNSYKTLKLLKYAAQKNVEDFVFSSTAAVYGNLNTGIAKEDSPLLPLNPYGQSKLMSEKMIQDVAHNIKLNFAILRYFNVAGSDPEGEIGQSFPEATHLIKVACQTALGKRDKFQIFGNEYKTKDGTGVRDFIHVMDLAHAHVLALDYLKKNKKSLILNCGYGHGYSVKEVINTVKEISGVDFQVEVIPPREGDSAKVIADGTRMKKLIGWKPCYDDIKLIIRTAYEWEKNPKYE